MGRLARSLPHPPVSVIVFGSFARQEADTRNDIDVVVVRPREVDEDDDARVDSLHAWRSAVRRLSGNIVEVLEVDADEAATSLAIHAGITWRPRAVQPGLVSSCPGRDSNSHGA